MFNLNKLAIDTGCSVLYLCPSFSSLYKETELRSILFNTLNHVEDDNDIISLLC